MRHVLPYVVLIVLVGVLVWFSPFLRCDDDACRVSVAADAGNPNLCASLDDAVQTWCYTDVAAATQDAVVCDMIADVGSSDHCRASVAVVRDDLDACLAVETAGARDNCLDALARARNTGTLCAQIDSSEFRDACAYDIGLLMNDVDACLSMATVDRSYRCVTFVALQLDSIEPCGRIPQPDKDWCVASVAIHLSDLLLCDEIDSVSVFSACRRQILLGLESENVVQ